MFMLGWDFENDTCSRFWRCNLIKICVKSYDMNSTLGSIVPLAMFYIENQLRFFSAKRLWIWYFLSEIRPRFAYISYFFIWAPGPQPKEIQLVCLLLNSVCDAFETCLMWLWLMKMPAQNLFKLLMMVKMMLREANLEISSGSGQLGKGLKRAFWQFGDSLELFGFILELACPSDSTQPSGILFLWQYLSYIHSWQ